MTKSAAWTKVITHLWLIMNHVFIDFFHCFLGFPSRWTYYDFFLRYRVLCHSKDIKRSDFRTTCENIITKLIQDEDKYQFGKTKLFFRAGQVAFMEKMRAGKLRDCGIMIQKHVKGMILIKFYQFTIYESIPTLVSVYLFRKTWCLALWA